MEFNFIFFFLFLAGRRWVAMDEDVGPVTHSNLTTKQIVCLPFHPKSHRKLPEMLTPDVPLTTFSARNNNINETKNQFARVYVHLAIVCAFCVLVCERPLTHYSYRMHRACHCTQTHECRGCVRGSWYAVHSERSYITRIRRTAHHTPSPAALAFIFRTFELILVHIPLMR